MEVELIDKKEFKGYVVNFSCKTSEYYDVVLGDEGIFDLKLVRKSYDREIEKTFKSKLYDGYLEDSRAYRFIDEGRLIGYTELDNEAWHNRMRISEILVLEEYRGEGYGTRVMDDIKELARREGFREIVLETETCNTNAIDFYLKNGFTVNSIDLSYHSNRDVEKKEDRIDMVYKL